MIDNKENEGSESAADTAHDIDSSTPTSAAKPEPEDILEEALTSESGEYPTEQVKKRFTFPNIGDFFVLIGLIFTVSVLVSIVANFFGLNISDYTSLDPTDLSATESKYSILGKYNFFTYLATMSLSVALVLIYKRLRHGISRVARFSMRGFNPTLILWGVVLMLTMGVVIEPLTELLPKAPDMYGRGIWTMVMVVVLAPVFEEFLCRGIILESARAKGGALYGLLFSSLLFAIIHIYPAAVVSALFMGLVLGYMYMKADSIFVVIILHAINNAIAYILMLAGYANVSLHQIIDSDKLYWTIYGVSVVVFLIAAYSVFALVRRLNRASRTSAQVDNKV